MFLFWCSVYGCFQKLLLLSFYRSFSLLFFISTSIYLHFTEMLFISLKHFVHESILFFYFLSSSLNILAKIHIRENMFTVSFRIYFCFDSNERKKKKHITKYEVETNKFYTSKGLCVLWLSFRTKWFFSITTYNHSVQT